MQVIKSIQNVGTILVRMSAQERTWIESFTGHRMTGERSFASSCCYQQPGCGYYLIMGRDEVLANAQRTLSLLNLAVYHKGQPIGSSANQRTDNQRYVESVRMNRAGEVISRSVRSVAAAVGSAVKKGSPQKRIVLVRGFYGSPRHPMPVLVDRSRQAFKGLASAIGEALEAFATADERAAKGVATAAAATPCSADKLQQLCAKFAPAVKA